MATSRTRMPRPLPPSSRRLPARDDGRRDFLRALAGAAVWALAAPAVARGATIGRAPRALRIALFTPHDPSDATLARRVARTTLGARLGLEEAAHATRLFGAPPVTMVERDGVDGLVADAGAQVLLGGWDDATALASATAAERAGVVHLNVGADGDALRDATRHPWSVHVAPSAAMLRAAHRATRFQGHAVAWHESLERYGAAQLTARFRARTGTAMDADAWCGWAAVKAVSEAALRGRTTEPPALRAALLALRFDGQKGRPLSFGADDRQLRQPLYLVRTRDDGTGTATEIADAEDAT